MQTATSRKDIFLSRCKKTIANFILTLSFVATAINVHAQPDWKFAIGSTDADIARATATDATGNLYITGSFQGSVVFGTTTLVSSGQEDIFLVKYSSSGVFQWAKRAGGVSQDAANAIAVSGTSIYLTGYFRNTANFNTPSATGSNEITNISGASNWDIFIAKFDDAGSFQWGRRAGGVGADEGRGITVSGSSVYVTGTFNYTSNFNTPSATGSNEIVSAGGTSDVFVAKYDDAGTFQWARRAGGTLQDVAKGISAVGNSIYITGYFEGTSNFNTPSATGNNEISADGVDGDIFVAKYNETGVLQWIRRAGANDSYDASYAISALGSSVYLTGYFTGTANFNTPSSAGSNEISLQNGSTQDGFVAKFNDAGIFQWAKNTGVSSSGEGRAIAASGSSIYITGSYLGTTNFNAPNTPGNFDLSSGGVDCFIAKFDDAGVFQWAKRSGGAQVNGFGAYGSSKGNGISVAVDSVYIVGEFDGTINFNTPLLQGSNELTSASTPNTDIFVARYGIEQSIENVTGNKEMEQREIYLSVFPNPAMDAFTIDLKGDENPTELLQISLSNSLGEEMWKQNLYGSANTINTVGFSEGIYFLQVTKNGKSFVHKLLIRK